MGQEHEGPSPEFIESMDAAFGKGKWKVGGEVPPMKPGDADFDFDEDGNDVTTTMIAEGMVAVEVTHEVHNVLDVHIVEVEEGYGALKFRRPEED